MLSPFKHLIKQFLNVLKMLFLLMRFVLFLQDNVIFERLTEASQYKELTMAHLEEFATEGKTS